MNDSDSVRFKKRSIARPAILIALVCLLGVPALTFPGPPHTWYVSATASSGGDGSAGAPFNSLALVQAASKPGDTIVVEPSPVSVPPLDGGIVLQSGQHLLGGGPPVLRTGKPLINGGPKVVESTGLTSLPGSPTRRTPRTRGMRSNWQMTPK